MKDITKAEITLIERALETSLYDNKGPSVFTEILEDTFNPGFDGNIPTKEQLKRILMAFAEESIELALTNY